MTVAELIDLVVAYGNCREQVGFLWHYDSRKEERDLRQISADNYLIELDEKLTNLLPTTKDMRLLQAIKQWTKEQ